MKNATLVFLRSKIKNISYFCSLKNVFVFLFYGEHVIIFSLDFSLVMEKKGFFYSLILEQQKNVKTKNMVLKIHLKNNNLKFSLFNTTKRWKANHGFTLSIFRRSKNL